MRSTHQSAVCAGHEHLAVTTFHDLDIYPICFTVLYPLLPILTTADYAPLSYHNKCHSPGLQDCLGGKLELVLGINGSGCQP